MADRIALSRIATKIHLYATFIVAGFLTMYIVTGFLMTRHHIWPVVEEKPVAVKHELSFPLSITVEDMPVYLRNEFNLRGHTGKPQVSKDGIIIIPYARPGIRYQVVVAADRKSVTINTTQTGLRATIVGFHRLKGFGGGTVYNLYVFMTDMTAISLILFALTGIYMGLRNGRNLFLKLFLLSAGVGYTLLVVFAFMKG
jgi:hypothetical protein